MDEFEKWYGQFGNSFVNPELARSYYDKNYGGGIGYPSKGTETEFNNQPPIVDNGFGNANPQNNYGILDNNTPQFQQGFQLPKQENAATGLSPIDSFLEESGWLGKQDNLAPNNGVGTIREKAGILGNLPIGSAVVGVADLTMGLGMAYKHRNDKLPDYALTQDMQRSITEGNAMRGQGFTPSEQKAYEQQIANDVLSRWRNAVNLAGGNMSQALLGAMSTQGLNAKNQMAIQDANLRRQNISMSNQLNQIGQNIDNMNTEAKQREYFMTQQAIGNSIRSGLQGLGSVGNLLVL